MVKLSTPMIPRTDRTMLAVAIELFGRHGFDGVTTRMLAAAAGTNVSSIKYHFGSKDELYVAAIDEIVAVLGPRIALVDAMLDRGRTLAGADPQRRAALVRQVVQAAFSVFLRNPEMRRFVPFVLRELIVPGPHFPRLYDALPRRFHELVTRLVAWIDDCDPTDRRAVLRAQAIIGQIVVFQIGRAILLRRLDQADYGDADVDQIAEVVCETVLGSLGLPIAETAEDDPH